MILNRFSDLKKQKIFADKESDSNFAGRLNFIEFSSWFIKYYPPGILKKFFEINLVKILKLLPLQPVSKRM